MVCERKSKGSFTLSKCIAKLLVKLLAAATVNEPALVNLGNTTQIEPIILVSHLPRWSILVQPLWLSWVVSHSTLQQCKYYLVNGCPGCEGNPGSFYCFHLFSFTLQ
jgi:hypothetical protein